MFDAVYKQLFSHPEMVRDLMDGFVASDELKGLDYTTLEKMSDHYVAGNQRQRSSDTVWRVKLNDEWLYLYILLEFQSSVDTHMAVRMMTYLGLLYEDLQRKHGVWARQLLPPVLPIVLYTGRERWTAPLDLRALLPEVDGMLRRYQPQMSYVLIDKARFNVETLSGMRNLLAYWIRMEQSTDVDAFAAALSEVERMVPEDDQLHRTFVQCATAIVGERRFGLRLANIRRLNDMRMTVEEMISAEIEAKVAQRAVVLAEARAHELAEVRAHELAEARAHELAEARAHELAEALLEAGRLEMENRLRREIEVELRARAMAEERTQALREPRGSGSESGAQHAAENGAASVIDHGYRLLLTDMLNARYGQISPDHLRRIATANAIQCELWASRMFDTDTAEEVFADTGTARDRDVAPGR